MSITKDQVFLTLLMGNPEFAEAVAKVIETGSHVGFQVRWGVTCVLYRHGATFRTGEGVDRIAVAPSFALLSDYVSLEKNINNLRFCFQTRDDLHDMGADGFSSQLDEAQGEVAEEVEEAPGVAFDQETDEIERENEEPSTWDGYWS